MLNQTGINADSPLQQIIAARQAPVTGIAILGSHPATVAQAPFADMSWIISACSPHNFELRVLPRWDQWFEVHLPTVAHETRSYHYLRSLEMSARDKAERGENPVIWMRDKKAISHFPGAKLYPEKQMKDRFGPFCFTSSIAFMLAMAIVDCEAHGINQIGLWGIMQQSDTEYAYQRPGIQALIWQATQAGIRVLAPRESCLFDPPAENF